MCFVSTSKVFKVQQKQAHNQHFTKRAENRDGLRVELSERWRLGSSRQAEGQRPAAFTH